MEGISSVNDRFKFNNLCTKIKTRYPNLYEELGGKNIRRILRTTLVEYSSRNTSGDNAYHNTNS
jgi:hypothetical protein